MASLLNNPALLAGFPDWSLLPKYERIYQHLTKVDIPNRPPTLPTIYEFNDQVPHPPRHLLDVAKPHKTYVYVYDSSKDGATFANLLAHLHQIPQGPSDQMEETGIYMWFKRIILLTIDLSGLLLLSPGTWLLARDLHGVGDPVKDVLQAYVPQS